MLPVMVSVYVCVAWVWFCCMIQPERLRMPGEPTVPIAAAAATAWPILLLINSLIWLYSKRRA